MEVDAPIVPRRSARLQAKATLLAPGGNAMELQQSADTEGRRRRRRSSSRSSRPRIDPQAAAAVDIGGVGLQVAAEVAVGGKDRDLVAEVRIEGVDQEVAAGAVLAQDGVDQDLAAEATVEMAPTRDAGLQVARACEKRLKESP